MADVSLSKHKYVVKNSLRNTYPIVPNISIRFYFPKVLGMIHTAIDVNSLRLRDVYLRQ